MKKKRPKISCYCPFNVEVIDEQYGTLAVVNASGFSRRF